MSNLKSVLILLDVTAGTEFGIDLNVWVTDVNFRGLCEIPPGPHYIFFSVKNKYNDVSQRYGFFHCFSNGEIAVYRLGYIDGFPNIVKVNDGHIEHLRQHQNGLAPYPMQKLQLWTDMTHFINTRLIEKTSVVSGMNFEFNYTNVETVLYPENATASEITKHSMDKSYSLMKNLEKFEKKYDILGEFQIAFIEFLIGQKFNAFEYWKSIILLMCECDEIIPKEVLLFKSFLEILQVHFQEISPDFLSLDNDKKNILWKCLKTFFETIQSIPNLQLDSKRCQYELKKYHGWCFTDSDDSDEDKPVIVDV